MVFASAPFNLYNTNTDNKAFKQTVGTVLYQIVVKKGITVNRMNIFKSQFRILEP